VYDTGRKLVVAGPPCVTPERPADHACLGPHSMTIIAFKDGVVAVDSLVTCSGLRVGRHEKLWTHEGCAFAAAGRSESVEVFRSWIVHGRPQPKPSIDVDFCALEVSPERRILQYENGLVPLRIDVGGMLALGCGREIALGAMAAGASAQRAVEIACDLHLGCGPPIKLVRVW